MINKVIVMGRLARDPETRNFQNGGMVTNMRLLTSETWKDRQSGERRERTEGHTVAIYAEPTARYIGQHAKKGDLVYIEGQLETRKWQDQSGADRYTTEIVIRPYTGEAKIIPTGRGGRSEEAAAPGAAETAQAPRSPAPQAAPARRELDDEIPF